MKPVRILIIDDEKYEAALIEKCVNWDAEGFEVVGSAQTAARAMGLFVTEKPDLVFCDINMPIMDGLELSRWMKAQNREVHVIIVTGYRKFEYARDAVEIGVQNYILKPIQAEELLAAARKVCMGQLLVQDEKKEESAPRSRMVQDTIEYVEAHLSEPGLSLKDIASAVFVSTSHLSRTFKTEMGESPTEFILRCRMERCKELFDTTDLRVNEVAALIGITDSHYLGRCFKNYAGTTISEYRKQREES